MTDEAFYATVNTLREHASLRRQESLNAADVEQFKRWDHLFGQFDMLLLQRATALRLKQLSGGEDPPASGGSAIARKRVKAGRAKK